MSNYTSSIIVRYGDETNAQRDISALNKIIGTQGTVMLTDVIAEYIGNCAIRFNLSNIESKHLLNEIIDDLKTATLERI